MKLIRAIIKNIYFYHYNKTFDRIYVMPKSVQDKFRVLCSKNKAFKESKHWYWFNKLLPTKECKNILIGK